MKLHLLSDLHHEFFQDRWKPSITKWHMNIPETDCDVIALVGDIDVGKRGIEWAKYESERLSKPIVYIPGNHEYYSRDFHQVNQRLAESARNTNVHLLNKDEWVFEGVRFLGATFWTDFLADPRVTQSKAMDIVGQGLNDYHRISYKDGKLTPELTLAWHIEQKDWLEEQLDKNGDFDKTVVLTHTGPSGACQHGRFKLSAISAGFHSRLNYLVEKADLWCFGHTHFNVDTMIGDTRLVSNQFGYLHREECVGFDPKKMIII